jgi:RNA polymerase sigma-70 factor (ECF subfamily)
MNDVNETELIFQSQKGDAHAFKELMKFHKNYVYRFCFQLSREPEEADDLAQEGFIQAYEKINRYKTLGSFRAWICSISYRVFLNRRVKNTRHLDAEHKLRLEINYIAELNNQEECEMVERNSLEKAFEKLPVDYRQCLSLRFLNDASIEEIAESLCEPIATIKTRLHRGKLLLVRAINILEGSPHAL